MRRKALVLHPDDAETLRVGDKGWIEGKDYILDYKATRLKFGPMTDEEE